MRYYFHLNMSLNDSFPPNLLHKQDRDRSEQASCLSIGEFTNGSNFKHALNCVHKLKPSYKIKSFKVDSHKYNSNTLSSRKNDLAVDIRQRQGNISCYKKQIRQYKKTEKISNLPIIKSNKSFSLSMENIKSKQNILFAGGSKFTPDLTNFPEAKIEPVLSNFETYTSYKGGLLLDDDGTFVALLIPKDDLYNHFGKDPNKRIVKLLEELTDKFKTTKRGAGRQAYFHKNYANYGILPTRNEPGCHLSVGARALKKESPTKIVQLLRKLEHVLGSWTPGSDFSQVLEARSEIKWDTACTPDYTSECGVLTGFASALNYCSFLHVDQDFWLSIFLCNTKVLKNKEGKTATYFCFPSTGRAIGLSNGDCMIFNAMKYHCCSSKTDDYYNVDVYASSSYTKSRVVGGNSNSAVK